MFDEVVCALFFHKSILYQNKCYILNAYIYLWTENQTMFPCSPQWTYSPCISLCHRYIFLHCSAMSNTSSTNISSLAHLQTFASYIKSQQILQVIYSHFIRCHASSKYCASHILAPYEVMLELL